MHIRPLQPGEAEALTALAIRSKGMWGYSADFMASCVDELTVRPSDTIRYFVAADRGEACGFYGIAEVDERTAELDGLFVDPDAVGRGIGKALLEHALGSARDGGAATLLVQSDPNATAFYLAAGARQVGTSPSGSIPGRELPLLQFDLVT